MGKMKLATLSQNKKLGGIGAIYRSVEHTCPSSCPLRGNGCYAQTGNVGMQQKGHSPSDNDYTDVLTFYKRLPYKHLVRLNVSGDFLRDGKIDRKYIDAINESHDARPDVMSFGYTHAWQGDESVAPDDFRYHVVVNASVDNIADLDRARNATDFPLTVILPESEDRRHFKHGSHTIVVCPQQYDSRITCDNCRMCAVPKRKSVIGFKSHGSLKAKVSSISKYEVPGAQ